MATSLLIAEKMKVKQSTTLWLFNVDSEAFCYLLEQLLRILPLSALVADRMTRSQWPRVMVGIVVAMAVEDICWVDAGKMLFGW